MATPRAACLSRQALSALLESRQPESVSADVVLHLGGCEQCQKALEGLAADPRSWHEAVQALSDPENLATVNLRGVVSTLKSLARTLGDEVTSPPAVAFDLAFLEAPAVAGEVGQLKQYRLVKVIGQGGFGVVFQAMDVPLNRTVAVKLLSPLLAAKSEARQRFMREAQAAAKVLNENVIIIYAVDEFRGFPFLVMQCIDGENLQERLDREGALSVEETLRIGMHAAEGLAAAHKQGLVHRDVKPSNILLPKDGQGLRLTDFGLARAVDDASLTQSGVIAGTPQYMAPEQATGTRRIDARADLFSLGTVLYAMCTGKVPFHAATAHGVLHQVIEKAAPSIRTIDPSLPAWLDDIIGRLHEKDPAHRLQTAEEVAELLGAHLAHLRAPQLCQQPARLRRQGRHWRMRTWAAAAVAGACCIVIGLAAVMWNRPATQSATPPGNDSPATVPAVNPGEPALKAQDPADSPQPKGIAEPPLPKGGGFWPDKDDPHFFDKKGFEKKGKGGPPGGMDDFPPGKKGKGPGPGKDGGFGDDKGPGFPPKGPHGHLRR